MIKENNCQSKTLSKRGLTEYGGKLWMAGVLGNNTEIFAMWSKWQQRLDLMGGGGCLSLHSLHRPSLPYLS